MSHSQTAQIKILHVLLASYVTPRTLGTNKIKKHHIQLNFTLECDKEWAWNAMFQPMNQFSFMKAISEHVLQWIYDLQGRKEKKKKR